MDATVDDQSAFRTLCHRFLLHAMKRGCVLCQPTFASRNRSGLVYIKVSNPRAASLRSKRREQRARGRYDLCFGMAVWEPEGVVVRTCPLRCMISRFSYTISHALCLLRPATSDVDAGEEASAACASPLRPVVLSNRSDILQTCAQLVNMALPLPHRPWRISRTLY